MKYLGLWSLGYEKFFEKFVKPSGPPSYILNVRFLRTEEYVRIYQSKCFSQEDRQSNKCAKGKQRKKMQNANEY